MLVPHKIADSPPPWQCFFPPGGGDIYQGILTTRRREDAMARQAHRRHDYGGESIATKERKRAQKGTGKRGRRRGRKDYHGWKTEVTFNAKTQRCESRKGGNSEREANAGYGVFNREWMRINADGEEGLLQGGRVAWLQDRKVGWRNFGRDGTQRPQRAGTDFLTSDPKDGPAGETGDDLECRMSDHKCVEMWD
jgi:hypothetical protein